MINDVVLQQVSVCEREESCANYWIMHTLSNYVEDCQLCTELCTCI